MYKKYYNSIFLNFNKNSELQYLELPEKIDSEFVRFDKWNNSTTATVSFGNGISTIPLHFINDGLRRLV